MWSGRVSALAVAPTCTISSCKILVGAAGGGLWEADNALEPQPNWRPTGKDIPTTAIGTILFDPTDSSGRTIYVGTGEGNQTADTHIGLGLFRSTDFGRTWGFLASTAAIAAGRAINSVLVDPRDRAHLLIGTDVAFIGASASSNIVYLPPGRPRVGVYESFDGGQTWAGHMIDVGASQMAFDPRDPDTLYVATNWQGVYRRSRRLDGDDLFHRVLQVTINDRAAIAVTEKEGRTRIYAAYGGANSASTGTLKRADNADVPTAQLLAGWTTLTSSVKGTPGYTSYRFCTFQCYYDIVVASPPGRPDVVWLGGSIALDDLDNPKPPSNLRTLLRSTDGGVSFADVTKDAQSPPETMHPDQHAIAFAPFDSDVAFLGSDGGVVRTSGQFVDVASDCLARGLTGGDLINCQRWLSAVPTKTWNLNRGLATLQFQSVSVNPRDPWNDIIGGTQDNGTWAYNGRGAGSWFAATGGDGGQSGIDAANPSIRAHMYFYQFGVVNFRGNDPLGWLYWHDPLAFALEPVAFYARMIVAPTVSGTWFVGMGRVWRTQDNGGPQAFLEQDCNRIPELSDPTVVTCGDWVPLGPSSLTGIAFGTTKPGTFITAIQRAPGDRTTLWAATGRGRLFISRNADDINPAVTFERLDTSAQPNRTVSGIALDGANPHRAFVSYSGYSANTPAAPGHIYEVVYSKAATYLSGLEPATLGVGELRRRASRRLSGRTSARG